MDTDGSFTCMCNIGYTGDGMTCNGKNACHSIACLNIFNYFILTLKYTDIDECNSGYDNCTQLTSCVNTNGSFSCVCNTGYTGDGDTCYSEFKDYVYIKCILFLFAAEKFND